MYTSIWMVFLFPLAAHAAKCFLMLSYSTTPSIIFPPFQAHFLLHKTSVEYTRLYSSIAKVLIYTVEPRIPCNDVFSKCWIVESNPVGARILLKLYISSVKFSPFIVHYEQIIHSLRTKHVIIITIHALLNSCFMK